MPTFGIRFQPVGMSLQTPSASSRKASRFEEPYLNAPCLNTLAQDESAFTPSNRSVRLTLPSRPPQVGPFLKRRQVAYLKLTMENLRGQNPKGQLDWQDAVAVMRLAHKMTGNHPTRFSELCREALFNPKWGMEKHGFVDKGIQDQFSDPYNPDGQLFHILELALPASSNAKTYYGGLAHPSWVMGLWGGHQLINFWHEVVEVKAEKALNLLCRGVDWVLPLHLTQRYWPKGTSNINPGLGIGEYHWRDANTYRHSAAIHKQMRHGKIEDGIRYLETQMLMPPSRKIDIQFLDKPSWSLS